VDIAREMRLESDEEKAALYQFLIQSDQFTDRGRPLKRLSTLDSFKEIGVSENVAI
jgi:hypothetical protein